jgi:quercetin dioxygenase-like cupin family protein
MRTVLSHVVVAGAAALLGSGLTYATVNRASEVNRAIEEAPLPPAGAGTAQAQTAGTGEALQTVLFETTLEDLLGRVAMVREFERAPGTGGTPHRHPGSHTFGYVLEGTYEVQVDDGPLRSLGPGETFYESPGALHAVSRNGSTTEVVRYLVFTISDPTLPATVPE